MRKESALPALHIVIWRGRKTCDYNIVWKWSNESVFRESTSRGWGEETHLNDRGEDGSVNRLRSHGSRVFSQTSKQGNHFAFSGPRNLLCRADHSASEKLYSIEISSSQGGPNPFLWLVGGSHLIFQLVGTEVNVMVALPESTSVWVLPPGLCFPQGVEAFYSLRQIVGQVGKENVITCVSLGIVLRVSLCLDTGELGLTSFRLLSSSPIYPDSFFLSFSFFFNEMMSWEAWTDITGNQLCYAVEILLTYLFCYKKEKCDFGFPCS